MSAFMKTSLLDSEGRKRMTGSGSDASAYSSQATADDNQRLPVSAKAKDRRNLIIAVVLVVATVAVCLMLGIYFVVGRRPVVAAVDSSSSSTGLAFLPSSSSSSGSVLPPPANFTCAAGESPARCLRSLLPHYGLSAYLVPSQDEHQNEFVAASDQRLRFISNFTGDAGTAVIVALPDVRNFLFTDSRFYTQAGLQLNHAEWQWSTAAAPSMRQWLNATLPAGSAVGIDPALILASQFTALRSFLAAANVRLLPVSTNLVELVWGSRRPPPREAAVYVLPLNYTGEATDTKLRRIRAAAARVSVSSVLLTELDDIAWTLNLRGDDIEYNPVFISYLLVNSTAATLYIDRHKTSNVQSYLALHSVTVRPYDALIPDLQSLLATAQVSSTRRLWLSSKTSYAVYGLFSASDVYSQSSPASQMKAVKNAEEVAGMRRAHLKDSAAFVCFFAWLEQQLSTGQAVDECSAATKIEDFRHTFPDFVELSYPTIAGSGPNGAIIHYEPTPPTCAAVTRQQMLLLDSGGQWLDGTTDTTRTVHYGNASLFERHTFTRVLQGAVEQMQQVWPNPQTPSDFLARQPLLRDGLVYGHGTSHGVGEMLFVHEDVNGPWVGGVVSSVEPGYYHIASNDSARNALYPGYDRGFGVRIETDCLVVPMSTPLSDARYWTYEPLAFVPMQASLMRTSIMTDMQIQWLNDYHRQCREKLEPWLKDRDSAMQWLIRNTQTIVKRNDD